MINIKVFQGTKGEWKVSNSGNSMFNKCVTAEDGGSVCFISNWGEHEANAKFIAAGPIMYAALLMAKEELIFGGDWNTAKRIIDEAIEQAL